MGALPRAPLRPFSDAVKMVREDRETRRYEPGPFFAIS
jgi:hypothetical protein